MTTWHPGAEDLATYRGGAAGLLLAASLETHLLSCARCRRALGAVDMPDAVTDSERRWQTVSDALDAQLDIAGGRHFLVRVAASTGPLAAALAISVVLVLALPLVALWSGEQYVATALLSSAPLAPMVAVLFAFRRETDPAGELSEATPVAGIRLVARRAVLVAAIAAPIGVVGALASGLSPRFALAWLLPGLALSGLVLLAGTTRVEPAVVTAVVGATWAMGVLIASMHNGPAIVAGLIASLPVQATTLLVALAAAALVAARRDRLDYRRYP
ncbi:hypothetical protein ACH436_00490 [Isoptericola sp. NPDC019693]|uniref:hypothetical protein n=1 Tax=Isoptericola sp. NPDC019693 TaxID=3364009 RepID=UPI00378FBB2F